MAWVATKAGSKHGGNAIIVIITKQASGTANIDRLMLAFNTIALASHSSEPCKFQDLGRVHS